MDTGTLIFALAAGGALGALVVWASYRTRVSSAEEQLRAAKEKQDNLQNDLTALTASEAALKASLKHEGEMREAFKALSSDALRDNRQEFLDLAQRSLLAPIKESLDKVDVQVQGMEKARQQAYGSLIEQVQSMAKAEDKLRSETGNLVNALRTPSVRGRWGEMQLQNVVEMAGMLEYCDFETQKTITTEDGRLRPDMIVRMPGGKNVIVDAKVPLLSYMDAWEAPTEEERRAKLKDHTRLIRDHMKKLSAKGYWEQFDSTPELVVMFLPGESFFSAALEQDPDLIEEGFRQRVVLATPTTLFALLRTVAFGWRQENIAENIQKVSDLGKQLYDRLRVLGGHFSKVGKGLESAVENYNRAVGSLEHNVLTSARRFPELGVIGSDEIPKLEVIDKTTRSLQATDLKTDDEPEITGLPSGPRAQGG
jgi:DNA recombination protein RmuC